MLPSVSNHGNEIRPLILSYILTHCCSNVSIYRIESTALFNTLNLTHWSVWEDLPLTWKHKYSLPAGGNYFVLCNSTGAIVSVVFNGFKRGGVYVAWTQYFFFVVLYMSGCHLYLRCCSCFDLWYCLYYQVEMRWMLVSNYLRMMYDQLMIIKQVSLVSE